MRIPLIATCAAFVAASLNAEYVPTSSFLLDPESIKPYLIESADFWIPAYDETYGGFFSEVGIDGQPFSSKKAVVIQSRNAYAMVKAFQITGDESYLEYADGALRFMYEYGWDSANQGWWGQVSRTGTPDATNNWYNSTRWSFWQHYQILGPAVMAEVTADPFHIGWVDTANQVNDDLLWDDRPGYEGYYQRANLNWSNPREKGFTPTVDAMTTNTVRNYLNTRSEFRKTRLIAVADNIVDHLVGSMDDPQIVAGFAEEFSTSWNIDYSASNASIGHFIKTAWCLARAYILTGDEKYTEAAQRILDEVMDPESNMWDFEYNTLAGGAVNMLNGLVNGTADWWTIEQGFTSGLMNWYATRKDSYLQMADGSIDFFVNNYYDETYGEVYSVVTTTGVVTSSKKGDMFKGGYHSVELFYLLYLYGNLYYHDAPVELYYRFSSESEDRDIQLWPVEMEDDRLVIAAVEKDGVAYHDYDATLRSVHVPANEGGIYKVTFQNRYPANITPDFDADWLSNWMGWIFLERAYFPWVYHVDMGWTYEFDDGVRDGGWYYSTDPQIGYFFSMPEFYPWVFTDDQGWTIFEGAK